MLTQFVVERANAPYLGIHDKLQIEGGVGKVGPVGWGMVGLGPCAQPELRILAILFRVWAESEEIVRNLALSVIMVTHSMAQALHFGDRTVMFHRGQIVFDVAGDERRGMTVPDLIELFKRDHGEELSDDALLLS
jgi:hypothetical protein